MVPDGPWELCQTLNDSWGYKPSDINYKSPGQVIRCFAETIGMGGNLLLNISPRPDGTVPYEQVERLEALGDWAGRYREAVYATVAGLPAGHFYGPSTLSADCRVLYLFCFDTPRESITVRGLKNAVRSVRLLGTDTDLAYTKPPGFLEVPGRLEITAPDPAVLDPHVSVIAIELDGELELYRGQGRD